MTSKSVLFRFVLTAAAVCFATSALAQWQWIGKDGRKVFSDQAPPAEVKDKDILKRPGARVAATNMLSDSQGQVPVPAARASAATSGAASSAPKLSGQEAELEARKKQAEKEEELKKKADQEKQAKARDDSCNRAKVALTTLQSGVRIGVTNAAGERDVMDDAKRADETKRAKEIANTNCLR